MVTAVLQLTELGLFFRLFFYKKVLIMVNENIARRKSNFVRNLAVIVSGLVIVSLLSVFLVSKYKKIRSVSANTGTVIKAWKQYDYVQVYELTRQMLENKPFNNFALAYHGYAAFYLAVSSLDSSIGQEYLDTAINSIRVALLHAKKSVIPQLEYMLGKSYFYKNTISSHYYSDLAVKYLQVARNHGYKADDISEYLGLSYAVLGKHQESIQYFTESLLVRESDSLLLSIAEQYFKSNQPAVAKQYLYRITSDCNDDGLVIKSMNLLGLIYLDEGKLDEAQQEFEGILQKNKNSGDAYYGLGVIYEKKGELIKARAEWRKALRVQVNHQGALKKMADYN